VEHERLVALLFAKGRLDEAARLAREGLAAHPRAIELLLQLSRAEAELGHPDEAIAAARDAHLRCRSRDSLTHLLRLLSATRRFTPQDGERLRRAVRKHPDAPVLLQAAGMFEAIQGDPWAAIGLLRTALRLESDEGIRSEIERELARLEASGDRAARGVTPITAGI
jgi:tetratricopeptide (TPR) repeat protein